MAKWLYIAFCIVALSSGKGIALKCYYCNDFDDKGPNCSTITGSSELEECVLGKGYKTYCLAFKGDVVLSRQGVLAVRTSSKIGEIKSCLSWQTSSAPPIATCYPLDDVRHGYALNGVLLERVGESILGTQCYCNQTDGCNYNVTSHEIVPTGAPYLGGVDSLRPMVALLLILPVGTILKLIM